MLRRYYVGSTYRPRPEPTGAIQTDVDCTSGIVPSSKICNKCKMAGRKKRTLDIELATRLHNWRIDSDLTYSSVAERLGVAVSTVTRSMETHSFSSDLRERALMLLKEDEDTASDAAGIGQPFVDGISANDLRFLRKFVKLIPKAEEVLKSALRRRPGGAKS